MTTFIFEDTIEQGLCYINGSELAFSAEIANGVKLLCDKVMLLPDDLSEWSRNATFVELAAELLNQGYWYLAEVE